MMDVAKCGAGLKEPWKLTKDEYESITNSGCVYDGIYYNGYGEPIPIGSGIDMNFAGQPIKAPYPWRLKMAKNEFSTVNYKYNVMIMVEYSNGRTDVYPMAHWYSPYGTNDKKYFNEFLSDPLNNGPHARIVRQALEDGKSVPEEVLAEYNIERK